MKFIASHLTIAAKIKRGGVNGFLACSASQLSTNNTSFFSYLKHIPSASMMRLAALTSSSSMAESSP